jgi:hypothetical protein
MLICRLSGWFQSATATSGLAQAETEITVCGVCSLRERWLEL